MLHGFKKLRPAKTQEELDAEKVLAEFEAGKYGKNAPAEKPASPPPPVEDPDEKLIQEELRRKKGYKKLAPGS
jgi:hypothetical protein